MEVVWAGGGPCGAPTHTGTDWDPGGSLHIVDDRGVIVVTVLLDEAAGLLGGRRSPPDGWLIMTLSVTRIVINGVSRGGCVGVSDGCAAGLGQRQSPIAGTRAALCGLPVRQGPKLRCVFDHEREEWWEKVVRGDGGQDPSL